MRDEDQTARISTGKSREFGCFVALAFPVAVAIAFGATCAAIGEVKGEREVGMYAIAFPLLGIVSLVAAVLLWSTIGSKRNREQ